MQMKKTTQLLLAASVTAAMLLTGCSTQGSAGSAEPEKITIGVVLSDASNPFFQTMAASIKEAAGEQGIEIIERSAPVATDNETFNNNVDSLITLKVDGIISAPIGASNLQAMKRAVDAGIPIVELDSAVPGWDGAVAEIQTDNVAAGASAVETLLEGLEAKGKKANILIINNTLGYKSVDDRTAGAKAALEAAGAKLVQIVDGGVSQAEAQANVETVLRAHPEVTGIMGTVSVYGLGAVQALRTTGNDPGSILITGVDGSDAEFKSIKEGTYFGTAAQQPGEMGVQGLARLVDTINGKTFEKSVRIAPLKVTAANVAEFQK
jgi:ribose transport system substrate-binding protein